MKRLLQFLTVFSLLLVCKLSPAFDDPRPLLAKKVVDENLRFGYPKPLQVGSKKANFAWLSDDFSKLANRDPSQRAPYLYPKLNYLVDCTVFGQDFHPPTLKEFKDFQPELAALPEATGLDVWLWTSRISKSSNLPRFYNLQSGKKLTPGWIYVNESTIRPRLPHEIYVLCISPQS